MEQADPERLEHFQMEAYAHVNSILRLRRPSPEMVSVIFHVCEDRQPWVLNLLTPDAHGLCEHLAAKCKQFQAPSPQQEIRELERRIESFDPET